MYDDLFSTHTLTYIDFRKCLATNKMYSRTLGLTLKYIRTTLWFKVYSMRVKRK